MLRGFKDFILRGNVLDLAVAVVIGAAFGVVITSFVADIITPVIAAIGGEPDFGNLSFTINNSRFAYGHFLNAVISFLFIAAAVYFFVIPSERPDGAPQARRGARGGRDPRGHRAAPGDPRHPA